MMNASSIKPHYVYLSFFFFYICTTGSVSCTFPTSVKKQQRNSRRQLISDISGCTSTAKCWCSGGRKKNQINNSRPGRFNVDTMMTKDTQGCGQQWRTQPRALPSSVNCCLATGFTLTGLQAAVCCLWPHLGGGGKAVVCYKSRAILATVAMH